MGPKKPASSELGQAYRYDVLGYTFAAAVIVFAGLGYAADRWLGTLPFLTVGGTLVGAGLAFVWVFAKVRRDEERYREERRQKGGGGGGGPGAGAG